MLLETKGIRKQFNGAYALDGIDFRVEAGQVHGLVGENGAGKSTLIKILTGVYQLEEGEVFLNGTPLISREPKKIREAGICAIHQDFMLVPNLSVLENIYLGISYPKKGLFTDWKTMKQRAAETMDSLGISLDLNQTCDELTPPQKTCLEIVRAMMNDCLLLILDEPTASLTDRECEILFRLIHKLKEKGKAILYISHRMDEIIELTDQVTVMKNGKIAGNVTTKETTIPELIALMADEWTSAVSDKERVPGKTVLDVKHLATSEGKVRDVSFSVREGEILGIFGLGGSGRTELLEGIYGYRRCIGGEVHLYDKAYQKRTPAQSVSSGMVLISRVVS